MEKSHEIEAVLPRGESDDQRRCCEIDPMVYPLNSLLMEIITDVRQPESAEGGGLNESPRVRRQSHPGAITREFRIPSSTDPTNQPTNERRVSSSTLALTPHHPLLWYLIATQPPPSRIMSFFLSADLTHPIFFARTINHNKSCPSKSPSL